jgi:DNA mismatch endonuclease (patch repair protein)
LATTPATNGDFWRRKFEHNVARDRKAIEALMEMDWRVLVVWECGVCKTDEETALANLLSVTEWLQSEEPIGDVPPAPYNV